MKEEIARIVEQSHPECGLKKACNTECGECGAGRIIDYLLAETEKMENPIHIKTEGYYLGFEKFRKDFIKLLDG